MLAFCYDCSGFYRVSLTTRIKPDTSCIAKVKTASVSVQPVFWTLMLTDLGVSYQDLANAQAVQLMGLSFGCVIFIPFAKKFGRRPIYITSTLIVALASWWSRYMTSLVELYLTNLLVGLAGAVNETAAQMTVRH